MWMFIYWILGLAVAWLTGRLITRLKMPAILGWLIAGMLLGPHALGLLPQSMLDAAWYKLTITWMQCAFGLMLGTELVWRKIKSYGRALVVTTLTQSLGTFAVVSLVFAIVFFPGGCSALPSACVWRHRTCDSAGSGSFHRTGISHEGTSD